jgi:predicted transcriptional regulator
MTMKIDGAKLRQLRYERFLNVGELANKAGLNAWTISRLESGD